MIRVSLFWKILLSFWATLALAAGSIILTIVLRDDPIRRGPDFVQIHAERERAAAVALSTGGDPALREVVASWPATVRGYLRVDRPAGLEPQVRLDEPPPPSPPTPIGPLAVELFFGLVFSVILAAYLTRPVGRLKEGFERLAAGDFAARLTPAMRGRRDEIADLARDFDVMAAQLQHLVSLRDRLLHDVSHELRSPLARMSLAIALARQNPARAGEALDRIEADGARLNAIVGDLLSLARAEAGAPPEERYFDVCHMLEVICADARFEAEPRAVDVCLYVDRNLKAFDEAALVAGTPELIRRALENVIRNAVRFSPRGAAVTIDTRRKAAGGVIIEVHDQGPGIDAAIRTTLFEPFVKAPSDATGVGLGLAIAQRALAAQGGTIEAVSPAHGGTMVRISLG